MRTVRAYHGAVVAPHSLAAEAGLDILKKGGTAVQAAVATAATLCVVYPHMTGLGGDAFWQIMPGPLGQTGANSPDSPRLEPVFIDACGRSAALGTLDWYQNKGSGGKVPKRGGACALTMAGAVSGWEAALSLHLPCGDNAATLTLADVFANAIGYAQEGFPVSNLLSKTVQAVRQELADIPGFAETFLCHGTIAGQAPDKGARLYLPNLGNTLHRLAEEGLHAFYSGSLAKETAAALEKAGSPLREEDFFAHKAEMLRPLSLRLAKGTLYNSAPPTQGVSSLMILGIMERYAAKHGLARSEDALIHAAVEATKQAFLLRDKYLGDPEHMGLNAQELLDGALLDRLAAAISPDRAMPWPPPLMPPGGDTVWFGAADVWGNMVSCIQSVYHEFGTGLVLPQSGLTWHNRGLGFCYTPGHPNGLGPGKKPFHTLNPAFAVMDDGRRIAYGTMGGEGQPQTQAAIFTRYALLGKSPAKAVAAPRWLLGRAWGDQSDTLKLEASYAPEVFSRLADLGHDLERVPAFSSMMGHAGMIVRHPDALLEAGADPRSDGAACAW
ncbi:gamma-glutamyltransferase family protein [Desulfovibrio sp. OttesenSCG-928-G15]|nr:gamma-glutamyltransferase family protein [Desulfovibrio sp. OttesenSCG-928-G15]